MTKDFLPTNTFFYPRTRLSPYFEGTQAAGAKPTVFITICIYQVGTEIQMRSIGP